MNTSPLPSGTASAVLFPTGQTVATPGALRLLAQFDIAPMALVAKHIRGDWGDVPADDAAANNDAVRQGGRILSSYPIGDQKVWVITEWDRSATTILLPEEY